MAQELLTEGDEAKKGFVLDTMVLVHERKSWNILLLKFWDGLK